MIIGSLEINNILSIENASLKFGTDGLVLVEGYNYDDDTANGAGKTAIFNALSFGLYGKFPRKVTVSGILRRGSKRGNVVVGGIQTNDGVWSVDRGRPSKVAYYKDGIEQDITQESFEKKIGMSYSQFLIAMYTAQIQGEKLIDLNDSGKKDFFLRFMNLEEFSDVKKAAENEIKAINDEINDLRVDVASMESRIEAHGELLVDEDALNEKIETIVSNIEKVNAKIVELSKIKKPDLSKFAEVEKKLREQKQEVYAAEAEKSRLGYEYNSLVAKHREIEDEEMPGIEKICPECLKGVRVVDESIFRIEDMTRLEEQKQKQLDDLSGQMKKIQKERKAKDATIDKRRDLDKLERRLHEEKNKKYEKYEAAQAKISECRQFIYRAKLESENAAEQLSSQQDRKKELERTKKSLKTAKSAIENHAKEIDLLRVVAGIYSPIGAPAYIMDSVIDAFNDKVSRYIDMVWPNASYSLQSFKENKDGEIRAKFSEKLVINGSSVQIGSLSGGQHRCLSIATDFALQDVLNERFSIEINPVILDEPFTGLDLANRERVIDMLSQVTDREIWVIDHASETRACFTNVIFVELRNGISTISVVK